MPITLEKLFSPQITTTFPFLGDDVTIVFAPWKWTAEMQEIAEATVASGEAEEADIAAAKDRARILFAEAEATEPTEPEVANATDAEAATVIAQRVEAAKDLRVRAATILGEVGSRELHLSGVQVGSYRRFLGELLVSWDVLGEDGKPIPTDEATMKRLPTTFIISVFNAITAESQPDPTNAPPSGKPSDTGTEPVREISAQSPTGIRTSSQRARSASPRSTSTRGRKGRATTRSGGSGR